MSKSFIFDIDGTLVDSNDFHALAWQRAFLLKGKALSLKQIRPHIGKGADQLLPIFLAKEEVEQYGDELEELQGHIFKREYFSQVRPFPKVRELFKSIRDADGKIALASCSDQDDVKRYETMAQIEGLVDGSSCADSAKKTKPAPDIFEMAMRALGNPPKNSVVVVGDTPDDAVAARKAGLPIIGVLCGGFSESDLKAHGCFAVYEDPADILAKLDALINRPGERPPVTIFPKSPSDR
jgi:HAD superfamily hydrolase (TIGR01509 family)